MPKRGRVSAGDAAKLTTLGIAAIDDFHASGRRRSLDRAISAFRAALHATPSGADRLAYVSNLGAALGARYELEERPADLDDAIQLGREAVQTAAVEHPDRPTFLSNLGTALAARFDLMADVADLDEAIRVGREAVQTSSAGNPDRPGFLSNLGTALATRYTLSQNVADLDEAVDTAHKALETAPSDYVHRPALLSNLGDYLTDRFVHGHKLDDIDEAIRVGRQEVDSSADNPLHEGRARSNLATRLFLRFERTGIRADLDDAIGAGYRALRTTGHKQGGEPLNLSTVAAALHRRFELNGDQADLADAVRIGRQVVASAPLEDPRRDRYLSNLALSLHALSESSGEVGLLEEAIHLGRQALRSCSLDDPDRPGRLSNLGSALHSLSQETGRTEELQESIRLHREAVDATPTGHADAPMYLSNLGAALVTLFEQTGQDRHLDAAIDTGRQAVQSSLDDSADQARLLTNLGAFLGDRYARTGEPADIDAAFTCWRQASGLRTGPPVTRLAAAARWGNTAADHGFAHEAAEGYATAVGLLPEVAWHGLDQGTRQQQLAEWAGLAGEAAACAARDGNPTLAVELLEQSRSIIWGQALNMRTDLTALRAAAPDLGQRMDVLRAALDALPHNAHVPRAGIAGEEAALDPQERQQAVDLRRRLARDWDDAVGEARVLRGFEHFMTATPYAELAATVVEPVVFLNASPRGCQALIVDATHEQPQVVQLPQLDWDAAVTHVDALTAALGTAPATRRLVPDTSQVPDTVDDVLTWLWRAVAEPVLDALGYTAPPGQGAAWPRMWWCPTGPLNLLPIHAAGCYRPARTNRSGRHKESAEGASVPDRVVSSYTTTLAALVRSSSQSTLSSVRQLTVAMPTTPGHAPLPAVPREVAVVASHFRPGQGHTRLIGSEATRVAVLEAISTHPWIHLACHAGQDQTDPLRSGFRLWDGALTIAELISAPTQERDLAFLSACETATGGMDNLDEALHLAAAMQFLGYRHVIATMWSIADSSAPDIAKSVYQDITGHGHPDVNRTAKAVHDAVQALRRQHPTDPKIWAPYAHFGP